MEYFLQDLLRFMEENGSQLIYMAFCRTCGKQKNPALYVRAALPCG